jgi:hypothetical protein
MNEDGRDKMVFQVRAVVRSADDDGDAVVTLVDSGGRLSRLILDLEKDVHGKLDVGKSYTLMFVPLGEGE